MVKQPKILIVEDERPMARALELKFSHSGFLVTSAYDGEEALAKLKADKFDLILLDLILPKMDGFVVLENIRKKGDNTPVMVTSNLGQDEDKERAAKFDVKGYFVKSNTSINILVEEAKKIFPATKTKIEAVAVASA